MKNRFTFVLAVFLAPAPWLLYGQVSPALQNRLQKADRQITRLSPAEFPSLPSNLVRELQSRRCMIPQQARAKTRENVIKGNFAKRAQVDWAVLCSRNRVSAILVFWGGSEKTPGELAKRADMDFLQDIGNDEIGFSRVINPIDRKAILKYSAQSEDLRPPPIDHQGIEDIFEGKASVVRYFYREKWTELAGED
jgi:hypothetical protein